MRASNTDSGRIVRRLTRVLRAASRYDLVLAVIPLALVAGTLIGATPGVPDTLGVGGGGVVALAATMYAMFGDPPVGPKNSRETPGLSQAD